MYLNTCVSSMWGMGSRVCILRLRISSMSPPRDETTSVFTPCTYYVQGVKWSVCTCTVFPQNLTTARFYFKAQCGTVTIRGWLDFEGGVYRDRHACSYTASVISLVVCTYNACAYMYMYYSWRSFTMWWDFEGGRLLGWVCRNTWRHFEGKISRCGEISRKYGMSVIVVHTKIVTWGDTGIWMIGEPADTCTVKSG